MKKYTVIRFLDMGEGTEYEGVVKRSDFDDTLSYYEKILEEVKYVADNGLVLLSIEEVYP